MKIPKDLSFAKSFNQIQDLLIVMHRKTRHAFFNKAWETMLGYDPDKLSADNVYDYIHSDDRDSTRKFAQEQLETKESTFLTNRYIGIDGSVFWISWHIFKDGDYVWCMGRDISLLKKHEDMVRETLAESAHAGRLVALGEMAASMGHEINNPLAIIQGYAEKLNRMMSEENYSKEQLVTLTEKILKATERINVIVRSLKKLSGKDKTKGFCLVSVGEIVSDCLGLCAERFRISAIDLKIDSAASDELIECVPSQISQVLLNLLNNAYDAVEHIESPWVSVETKDLKDRISITVKDAGRGIPDEYQAKLWLPFFTTKEVGKGTGLGLAISKRIIDSHSGKIFLDNRSQNTTFIVELPKSQNHSNS